MRFPHPPFSILERWRSRCVFATLLALVSAVTLSARPRAEHVVVFGVDGLSPRGILRNETPHIHALAARGAFTWHARAVFPTNSSPNWASMIMGAPPELHGVTSNQWEPDNFEIPPVSHGPDGLFPTIFSVLRQQRPDSVIAVFHQWPGFARLLERSAVNVLAGPPKSQEPETDVAFRLIAEVADYFVRVRPRFLFLDLDLVDHAGHTKGWDSPDYDQAVRDADKMLGQFVAAVAKAGCTADTIILFTADHGGRGTGHGGFTMAELQIPWILAGPGVQRGREIAEPVNTCQTAATLARIFAVTPPDAWTARPVESAFIAGAEP